jgi:heme/copper-type cytochrome/quinol oxidase subunit 4
MPYSARVKQLAIVAVLGWVACWFLPVMPEVPGWSAFRFALSAIWPYQGSGAEDIEDAVPQVLSALTNVVFVLMIAPLVRGRITRPGLFIKVAIACFILNLYWFVQLARDHELGDLKIGYYVWMLAFALLIVIGALIHRTSKTPTAGTPA